MDESKCKLCNGDLVYVGSITRGGSLRCLDCEAKKDAPTTMGVKTSVLYNGTAVNPGLGGSYAAQDDGVACEYCGTHHKIWEACYDLD